MPLTHVIALGLALVGQGEGPAAAGFDAELLAAAQGAQVAGDRARAEALYRAWATLAPRPGLPPGGGELAARALDFADHRGHLRVFATRIPRGPAAGELLRVGVQDPASVVERVEALVVVEDGRRAQLTRAESPREGRYEFRIEAGLGARTVVVHAYTGLLGAERLVRTVEIPPPSGLLPPPPAVPAPSVSAPPPTAEAEPGPAVPWWWVAGGVVAAVLVGAAIQQELRF